MAQKYNTVKNHNFGTRLRLLAGWRRSGREGFTVVELVVVIVVLGILMSLAILNVANSQVTGRDVEREEDAQAIARKMESLYDNSEFFGSTIASYPGTSQVDTQSGLIASEILEGLDRRALFAPGVPVTNNVEDMSLRPATNNSEDPGSITPKPGEGNDVYVYQPLKPSNALCETTGIGWGGFQDDCIRFNLYYWHEADNTVRKIMSRNQ